jgi:hypothetical protein
MWGRESAFLPLPSSFSLPPSSSFSFLIPPSSPPTSVVEGDVGREGERNVGRDVGGGGMLKGCWREVLE